jgi:hypothetical protein
MTTDLGGWTLVLHTDNIQINTYGSSLNKPIYKPDSYYDDKFLLVSPIKSIRFSCKINKASNSWDIDKIFENDSLTKIN